jgi:hypothetical protein
VKLKVSKLKTAALTLGLGTALTVGLGTTLTLGLGAAPSRAQGETPEALQETHEPGERGDELEFYLVTIGRGDGVDARFGHTVVRVVDKARGTDTSDNWGIFDYNDPNFALKFYIGGEGLRYMLGVSSTGELIRYYRDYEHRKYVQQRLTLTPAQKTALMARFRENAKPENVGFTYIHFFDNCATRVRDHLDAVLGGAVKQRFGAAPGNAHFRHYIRSSADGLWWAYLGLDMLSNSMLDRPVSKWEEMFLPVNLQRHLSQMPAVDDGGRPIPGVNLLGPEQVVIERPEPLPGANPYQVFGLAFTTLAVAATLAGRRAGSRGRTWGAALAAYGAWSAVWGTVMTLNWLASNHRELLHNANLWLFWPVDWLFVVAGVAAAWRGRARLPARLQNATCLLAGAHLAALAAFAVLWLTGVIHQDVLPVLAGFAPAAALLYGSWRRQSACLAVTAEPQAADHHAA